MLIGGANNGAVSLDDAMVLLQEVERLRAELSESQARVAELDRLAHRDPLVDLPNRRSFLESLEKLIARVERYGGDAALLFLDVDGLKAINDQFGHKAGDRALVAVSRLLVESAREADLIARLSGDEFAILLEHTNELGAWQMALRVIEKVDDAQFCVDGVCLPLSVAAGVALVQPGDTPELALERADREMYRIKTCNTLPGIWANRGRDKPTAR